MQYTVPNPSEPTPTPLSVYGNNAAVACPCGRVVVVRSLGEDGKGAWECSCHRWYKGYPENGQTITHILVWDPGNQGPIASRRIKVECPHQ